MAMKYVGILLHARHRFLRGSIDHGDNPTVTCVTGRHRSGGPGGHQGTRIRTYQQENSIYMKLVGVASVYRTIAQLG